VATAALIHFDGANNSTTITDVTGNHTWTANSGALDTSQFKFGSASVKNPIIAGDGALVWGTSDFTVDFWVNIDSSQAGTGSANLFELNPNYIVYYASNVLQFYSAGTGYFGATTVSFNVWHHIALTRQGSNHYLFLDGQLQANWSNAVDYGTSPAGYPIIGESAHYLVGWIDELRILTGSAAWTSSFTPPTSAYTYSTTYQLSAAFVGHGSVAGTLFTPLGPHALAATFAATGSIAAGLTLQRNPVSAYVALQRGMFLHFNLATFGGADFVPYYTSPDTFNPTGLNIPQWVDAIVNFGAKYAVLTVKHQDGFCLWPTTTTPHGIANSAWYAANGNPDIAQMFVNACRARGILPGFYYSIEDDNFASTSPTNAQFLTYTQAQITELLSRYGPVVCLWLDATEWRSGNAAPWASSADRAAFIHGAQPGIVLVNNSHTGLLADSDVIEYETTSVPAGNTDPAEQCNTPFPRWFWVSDTASITDPATIGDFITVTNSENATFLLNVPPNTTGIIPSQYITRLNQINMYLGETPRRSPYSLTSNTVPAPFVASALTEYPGQAAFNAFNRSANSFWSSNGGSLPTWIQIDLGASKGVRQYHVKTRKGFSNNQWTAWSLAGSNDGSSWTTVDSQSRAVVADGEADFFSLSSPQTYRYWRWNITSSNSGTDADVADLALYDTSPAILAAFAGSGSLTAAVTRLAVPQAYPISTLLAGAGLLTPRLAAVSRMVNAATFLGSGHVQAILGRSYTLRAPLLGAGSLSASTGPPGKPGNLLPISAVFSEGLIDPDTGLPYGTWHGRGRLGVTLGRMLGIFAQFAGEGSCEVTTTWLQADFIWPGIVENAGSQLLYRQAAGLEKSLADVDAFRLTQTYAELVRDQWDPYRISSTNLPYLAWAMGVNLWEDTWSEEFKRYWVANQWTMKYERGSALGLNDFVNTVNASPGMHAQIVNLIVPPACFYPGKALTDAERAAYVARFPQLRLYPYAPRPQLPYLGYLGGFSLTSGGQKIFVKNGHFLGPLLKYYPTNYNAGGDYLRSATLYEPRTGVETQLTMRTIVAAPQPGQKEITYDEISLSSIPGNLFYPGNNNKQYLLAQHPTTQKLKHAVVLGRLPYTPSRLVRIPRDGTLDRTQYQALFTTISTGLDPINVRPEQVYQIHPMRQLEWYCGMPLRRTYLTKSNAWQFLYERWYLFDPTRLPDNRKASTYMGRARFGIHKYTAEADIQAWFTWPKFYARANGYYGKGRFFPPKNTKLIDQIRRAVTASMAARDTVLIDTGIKRQIQIRDLTVLDGRFSIGQYVTDRTA
jgi:phage tail P2-like protein